MDSPASSSGHFDVGITTSQGDSSFNILPAGHLICLVGIPTLNSLLGLCVTALEQLLEKVAGKFTVGDELTLVRTISPPF